MDDLTVAYIGIGVAFFCFFGALAAIYKLIVVQVLNDLKNSPPQNKELPAQS